MDFKSFLIGFGIAGSLLFMALPEMLGFGNREPKEASRSIPAPAPARPRAIQAGRDASEEEISAAKDYQQPDHWKWKYESDANVVCEWIPVSPWEEERVCHTNFQRPLSYPSGSRNQPQRRPPRRQPQFANYRPPCGYGGCPYEGY
jgi:hypothetical protein